MNIIDTHCHLDFEVFDNDRDAVLDKARQQGVSGFIVPGVRESTWQSLMSLCDQSSDMYYALGLHPMFMEYHSPTHVAELKSQINSSKPVAIGEIGLDYYDKHANKEDQLSLFESQLQIACEANLPVILHVRKAHDEVLAALNKYPVCGGVVHAFNGSLQHAEKYFSQGFMLGFGGMLTYERSSKLRGLAEALPLSTMVLETDSPDMTVMQHRGERNSPEYLSYCLQAMAEVKSMSVEEVATVTTANANKVFKLVN